jgi:hypothetical protein
MNFLRIGALFLALSAHVGLMAQSNQVVGTSNYAGVHSLQINPANLATSRLFLDFNISSTNVDFSNNALGISRDILKPNSALYTDTIYQDNFQRFRQDFLIQKDVESMRLFQQVRMMGPSAMFSIGKNGFAITSELRQMFLIDNVDPDVLDFALDELNDPTQWNVDFDNKKFNVQAATWTEVGLAYGREIVDLGAHHVSGGVNLKFRMAAGSMHFYAEELNVRFDNADTMDVTLSDVRFGYSNNLEGEDWATIGTRPFDFNRLSVGADIGFSYEWRPSSEFLGFKSKNKYKLKAGVSLMDIGNLRFDRGTFGGNFSGSTQDWDLDSIDVSSPQNFGNSITNRLNMDTTYAPYSMRMPTTMGFQVDYNIWKNFYVGLVASIPFNPIDAPLKLHGLAFYTLQARFESRWLDVYLPITLNGHNQLSVGFGFRAGPVFVTTTDIFSQFSKDITGTNINMGLKVPILFNKNK